MDNARLFSDIPEPSILGAQHFIVGASPELKIGTTDEADIPLMW